MKGVLVSEFARHFVNDWVFNYGPSIDLLADNGVAFTFKFFQDVCKLMNIHNIFTTTYHTQANGKVKRYNRTIFAAFRTYVADRPRDWGIIPTH